MAELFGIDGVRGIANTELTAELAFKIGQAGAVVIGQKNRTAPRILVGKDTRVSGDMLEAAISAGMCSAGACVMSAETLPTPAVAYLVRKYKMDAGVVISASHCPMEYNGIKFFDSDGHRLSAELEEEIEQYVLGKKNISEYIRPGSGVGRITRAHTGMRDYVDFVKSTANVDLSGMKIAIDCANGASYQSAKLVFKELGADVEMMNNVPDGININDNCGSMHMDGLIKYVPDHKCHLGLALDGDADRLLAVDEMGTVIDGDGIMAICGKYLKDNGRLAQNKIVVTVTSSQKFLDVLDMYGIEYEQTEDDDRYVLENMLSNGYSLGGEQSGYIIFSDYNTIGDGLVTALQLVKAFKESGLNTISEFAFPEASND